MYCNMYVPRCLSRLLLCVLRWGAGVAACAPDLPFVSPAVSLGGPAGFLWRTGGRLAAWLAAAGGAAWRARRDFQGGMLFNLF